MQNLLYFFIAFFIGGGISFAELLFGKYKFNHKIVLKKCRYLVWYSILYGLISGIVTILIIVCGLNINGLKISDSPILTAIIIGLLAKAISKITLYNITLDNKSVPIGPKFIVDRFEEFLLKKLHDDFDSLIIKEITTAEKIIKKNRTLTQMDVLFDQAMPTGYSAIKRLSYMKEIKSLRDPFDKCRYFVDKFGVDRLRIVTDNDPV